MRFIVVALAALAFTALAFMLPVQAQEAAGSWSLLATSPSHWYRFEDGSFIDPSTGWVINLDGEVWRTTDAGATWSLQNKQPVPAFLRSTVFLNEQHGFFGTLTAPTVLYETTDAGETLVDVSDRISGPLPSGICGIWAVSDNVIYAAGMYSGPSHILKTTDGGQTWTSQDMSDRIGSLVDVYFWDEQRGIAVGGSNGLAPDTRAAVLMTEDGGETWTERFRSSDDGEWGWKITFPTPTTGYVSVENGDWDTPPAKVLKTVDGGLTWSEIIIADSDPLQGIGFITEDIGWASGRGVTSFTTDGGETWEQIGLDGDINRFEFFGDTLGYAMGHRIHKYEIVPTTGTEAGNPRVDFAVTSSFPNPFASATTIRYRTDAAADVELAVYDVLGRRVATLARGFRPAGAHEATWDGRAEDGRPLASGLYVVRLTAGARTATRRLTLLRR